MSLWIRHDGTIEGEPEEIVWPEKASRWLESKRENDSDWWDFPLPPYPESLGYDLVERLSTAPESLYRRR